MNALPDGPQRPVTLRDVAAAAGVSATTVSHVVNEKPGVRIGHDTRERVHAVVRQLGYRPNTMAKNLVTGGSRFLGLIADAIATTPFAGQIIHGAQDEAWRQGYVLLIANTEGDEAAETEAITMMLGHQVRAGQLLRTRPNRCPSRRTGRSGRRPRCGTDAARGRTPADRFHQYDHPVTSALWPASGVQAGPHRSRRRI